MLENRLVEDFTLKDLTRELGTAPMAVYTYFPNRAELLVAVADEVCLRFTPPKPGKTWQQTVLNWLQAIKKHADRYPVLPYILGIDGHSSSAWVKVTQPIASLLEHELGLKGKSLMMARFLFANTVVTMIRALIVSAEYIKHGVAYSAPPQLADDERHAAILRKTRTGISNIKEKELYDALFAQIVKGIEVFL